MCGIIELRPGTAEQQVKGTGEGTPLTGVV